MVALDEPCDATDHYSEGRCSRLGNEPGQEGVSSSGPNIGLRRQPLRAIETELLLKHLFRRSESPLHLALPR
jgi:hypothetical protein